MPPVALTHVAERREIKVADEVFIATALLQRENPDRADFTIGEIVERVAREHLTAAIRPGVRIHASQQCVANRQPNPGRYRMLYATGTGTRRLFMAGDEVYHGRTGKIFPSQNEVPSKYRELIDWAKARYDAQTPEKRKKFTGLLALRGIGKKYATSETADEYVARLREGWD